MTHKHPTLLLSCIRASTAAFLLMGLANVCGFHGQQYLSSLSGGGASVLMVSAENPNIALLASSLHSSAPVESSTTETQLMLGILFILAGFGFHALYVLRHEAIYRRDHPVRAAFKDLKNRFWGHLDKGMGSV